MMQCTDSGSHCWSSYSDVFIVSQSTEYSWHGNIHDQLPSSLADHHCLVWVHGTEARNSSGTGMISLHTTTWHFDVTEKTRVLYALRALTTIDGPDCTTVCGNSMEIVDLFVYLGSLFYQFCSSALEISGRISLARTCMLCLISHSSILNTKIHLFYQSSTVQPKVDSWPSKWETRCIWHGASGASLDYTPMIVSPMWTSNATPALLPSGLLRLYAHIVNANPFADFHRTLHAFIDSLPSFCTCPRGRSWLTWSWVIEHDLPPYGVAKSTGTQ